MQTMISIFCVANQQQIVFFFFVLSVPFAYNPAINNISSAGKTQIHTYVCIVHTKTSGTRCAYTHTYILIYLLIYLHVHMSVSR